MTQYPQILDQLKRGAVVHLQPVSGGSIANAGVATFADGSSVFVKQAAGGPPMFPCEADGLRELRNAGALRVPEVLAVSGHALVLEYIKPGQPGPGFFARFGQQLAQLHRARSKVCGFAADNFIGSTPQANTPLRGSWDCPEDEQGSDWPGFFLQRRLRYQAGLAAQNGHGHDLLQLLERGEPVIGELLQANCEPPSLLHGDLWAGNFMADEHGVPCLIDPAVYYGHREADLAMTRLFGGFDDAFYSAYQEAWPLPGGWQERLPIYQLYHLLNHLNLFGSSYYSRCKGILQRYT
jgi:fructosamine-3-kinase